MTDEEYQLPDIPFFEFIKQFDNISTIRSLRDIKYVVGELETFHLFESAQDLNTWHDYLSDCIKAEFDENCVNTPVECELDGEWLHEWELPEIYQTGENFPTL